MPNIFALNREFWRLRRGLEAAQARNAGRQELIDHFEGVMAAYRAVQKVKALYRQAKTDFAFTDSIDVPR